MKGNKQLKIQIKLAKIPTSNYPNSQNNIFQLKYSPLISIQNIKDGEVLVKNEYILIDASMRTWINGLESYTTPVKPGDVMLARTVGEVVYSKSNKFQKGDKVLGIGGWQNYYIKSATQLTEVPRQIKNPQLFLVLSFSGLSAYFGLQKIGKIKQKQVVVISAAAGGLGQIAVQIAKAKGCIVCGIAGGKQKCQFVKDLGADYAIDYKNQSVKDKLRDYFKTGVDVYLDNVGGQILDDVLLNIKNNSRVVLCGAISTYNYLTQNDNKSYYRLKNYSILISKRAQMKGFIFLDYSNEFPQAFKYLYSLISQGKLKIKIDMIYDLQQCPNALVNLLTGKTIGKVMVKIQKQSPKL